MKRFYTYLSLLLVLFCFTLAACAPERELRNRLASPENLRMEGSELVWDEVEHATGYIVCLDHVEYETQECRYDLSALTEAGDYVVEVMALGDDAFLDSEWAAYTYTIEPEEEVVPTANLAYTLLSDRGGYEVSRGNANLAGTVVIPDYYNGLPVVRIANRAFDLSELVYSPNEETGYGCNTVTTGFRLPKTLEEIGDAAFAYCIELLDIEIPYGVTSIGESAFNFCLNVNPFEIPDTVKTIGSSAFGACKKFVKVTLPYGLTELKDFFGGCSSLKELNIPSSITKIGWNGFATLPLESITLHEGITEIDSFAFNNCRALTEVHLPSTLKSIGAFAFQYCTSLVRICLPEGVEMVSRQGYEFMECTSLREIVLPVSLSASLTENIFGAGEYVTTIYYRGTESEWNEKVSESARTVFQERGVQVYFYAESGAPGGGSYWHFESEDVPAIW